MYTFWTISYKSGHCARPSIAWLGSLEVLKKFNEVHFFALDTLFTSVTCCWFCQIWSLTWQDKTWKLKKILISLLPYIKLSETPPRCFFFQIFSKPDVYKGFFRQLSTNWTSFYQLKWKILNMFRQFSSSFNKFR